MLLPIVLLTVLAVTVLLYCMLLLFFRDRLVLADRLKDIGKTAEAPSVVRQELAVPLYKRILQPVVARLSKMRFFLSQDRQKLITEKLVIAGNPKNLSPLEFTFLKYLAVALAVITGLFLTGVTAPAPVNYLLAGALGACLGWLLPDAILNMRVKRRQREVQKSLPDTLDLLTVSIEAGMGFDGAVLKVTEKTKGALSEELKGMLQEIHVGKPRREALRDLADRLKVDDLSSFVGAVIMAEQMGVRLGNVLRVQSDQMRRKRRQRAEEKALKAPIKMLFPLVFFIFPATFIILLGPAVIRITAAL
ncbi:MAG: type II secretion system F family protein [Bacillota bacterium]